MVPALSLKSDVRPSICRENRTLFVESMPLASSLPKPFPSRLRLPFEGNSAVQPEHVLWLILAHRRILYRVLHDERMLLCFADKKSGCRRVVHESGVVRVLVAGANGESL